MIKALTSHGYERTPMCGLDAHHLNRSTLRENGLLLKIATQRLQSDKEVVLAAVNSNYMAIQYADKIFKKNKQIIENILKRYDKNLCENNRKKDNIFLHIDDKFKSDKELIVSSISTGCILRHIDDELMQDRKYMFSIIKKFPNKLLHMPKIYLDDKEFVLIALQIYDRGIFNPLNRNKYIYAERVFRLLSDKLKNDKDILKLKPTNPIPMPPKFKLSSPPLPKMPPIQYKVFFLESNVSKK